MSEIDPDAAARAALVDDLDATMLVEAAAGTGKTSSLIARMLAILGSGRTRLSRMVAVTFTEKAAGEMKLRLRSALETARRNATDGCVRERYEDALMELEGAHIGTIHAFCAELLRERPIDAGVDPAFEVRAEDEAARVFEQVFDGWFSEILEAPPEGVRRLLRRPPGRSAPSEQLRNAALALNEQRDHRTPWQRPAIDRSAAIDAAFGELRAVAALAATGAAGDYLTRDLKELADFVEQVDEAETLRGARDHDRLEHELAGLLRRHIWRRRGRGRMFGRELTRAEVLDRREALQARLQQLSALLSADLAACLQRDLQPVVARYEARKAELGMLDFLDLLLRTRDLLRDDASIRHALQARWSHLFVDEFQDTDPLQAEILLMLARDESTDAQARLPAPAATRAAALVPGKLFVVGDPKQSIYSFRRADVELYHEIKRDLRAQGARILALTRSFRAVDALQHAINAAFAQAMAGRPLAGRAEGQPAEQAEYQALQPVRRACRERPSLIALSVPEPYNKWGNLGSLAIAQSVPEAVGAFVDWLVHHSGWRIEEAGEQVAVSPRHVCLLFRKFKGYGQETTRDYVRALETRRIPHVLVGGRSFHAREEVLCLRTALAAIEWPDDDLSVFATLRGPLFSLADDALLDYRHHVGPLHPLRPTNEALLSETQRPVYEALLLLRELHRQRNRRVIGDTINRLLAATRAHAGFAIWPTGEQALANLARVVDQARRFEGRGATSFRAFVERLQDEALRGQAGEAPVIEEGVEGVRIMTVHRAKGLEFPVVILCDPTAPRVVDVPSRFVDRERGLMATRLSGCTPLEILEHREPLAAREEAEEVRIAYVAATRARELLVVPAVGDQRYAGWVDVLHPALYPAAEHWRSPSAAAGCPAFGDDSVLRATARATRRPSDSVAPGEHRPECGEHRVVWWDPRTLELDRQPAGGLRQHDLLVQGEGDEQDSEGQRSLQAWLSRKRAAHERGAAPSLVAHTVTALSAPSSPFALADLEVGAAAVQVVTVEADRTGRPSGKRFGTLVHAVLAECLEVPAGASLEQRAALHGAMLGAPQNEIAAAADVARAALDHALLREARSSPELRVEAALAWRARNGVLIEGSADLVFRRGARGNARWVVVDFKTDAEPGAVAAYSTQLALYARAVEAATGRPAECVLLAV